MLTLKHNYLMELLFVSLDQRNHITIGMELMENGSVEKYLANPDNLIYLKDAVKWLYQTAKGMLYLYDNGGIHNDLAARNLLLDKDCNIKIADFGLAKRTGKFLPEYIQYETNLTAAMPLWMLAPEVLELHVQRKNMLFTDKSDVWEFGLLMWEVLSRGIKPFNEHPKLFFRDDIQAFINNLKTGKRPFLPPVLMVRNQTELDQLWSVITNCLQLNPSKRPKISELVNPLRTVMIFCFKNSEVVSWTNFLIFFLVFK